MDKAKTDGVADVAQPRDRARTGIESMDKVKTGIDGLDVLLNGGIPRDNSVLIAGGAGSGKTTLATQFLIRGIEKFGENGVYFSLEEPAEKIIRHAKNFGFPAEEQIKQNKLHIESIAGIYSYENMVAAIESSIEKIGAKRFVFDSTTLLDLFFDNKYQFRRNLLDLIKYLSKLKCTSLLIAETDESGNASRFGLEEFVVDGVIFLHNIKMSNRRVRAIEVYKMRDTEHSQDLCQYKITDRGFEVYPDKKSFWLDAYASGKVSKL